VLDRLEPLDRAAADALGRRIGRDELRMLALERLELAHEAVELGVADLGVREDVVALLVVADEAPQLLDAGPDRGGDRSHAGC